MTVRNRESFTTNPFSLSHSIVTLVRRGHASTRNELVELTGAGRSLIAQRVGELIDRGVLIEDGKGPSTGGRAPRGLRFNAEHAIVVGIEVGATSIDVAATDLSGRQLDVMSEDWLARSGPEATLAQLELMVRKMVHDLPEGHARVVGVGVGMPGPVDIDSGSMVSPPSLPGWHGYPIAQRLSSSLGYEVWVDNDVNVMAIGEQALGQGREHEDFVVLKLGTGIGAGIVIAGKLHRGVDGGAGDVGHIAYGFSESPCACGKYGCLSTIAGGMGIARIANDRAENGFAPMLSDMRNEIRRDLTAEDVSHALANGDPVAYQIVTDAGTQIGRLVALLVAVANPSLIVLAGGVSQMGDVLLGAVRTAAYDRAPALGSRHLSIRVSTLGAQAGAVGAALMCVEELLQPDRLEAWVTGLPELASPKSV